MTHEIFIYGVNSAGGRNIGIDIDGTRILLAIADALKEDGNAAG